jgi:hypothetical protein
VIRLGLRLTVSGGREAVTRLFILAAAVGIGVGLLLTAVTQGTNSGFATPQHACGNDYLHVAKPGYDAPTGLGTHHGTGAF